AQQAGRARLCARLRAPARARSRFRCGRRPRRAARQRGAPARTDRPRPPARRCAMSRVEAVRSWTSLALAPGGRSLIEASAGTGKTWTISVLYLRLLLERELSPAQIVVTTFTDAAAQELRERVRTRIAWAQREAEAASMGGARDHAVDADVRHWLEVRWRDGPDDKFVAARAQADLKRLRLAQTELDRA